MTTTKLVGREAELEVLAGLISPGRTGGAAIVMTGEPGIGKSALLAEAAARARAAGDISDAGALRMLGMAAHAIGDIVRSADFLDRAETMLRDTGRLGLLSQVLSMQVMDRLELGDWDRAAAAAGEGTRLAVETGQPIWRAGTLACDALYHAFRGQVEQAFSYAAEAELLSSQRGLNDLLSCAQLARGAALVATGQHVAAYRKLRRRFDPADPSFHPRERYGGVMFLAEAAGPAGQREDARRVVADLDQLAATTPAPLLHVHLRYARAVLADDAGAGPLYADLVGHGARSWADQARAELRASGERIIAPEPGQAAVSLSAQELQIARLAAEGLSNREIGERLYLSPRTVGSHLYRIFPSLRSPPGLSSPAASARRDQGT
jgi:DNA-binding CsgD family transcriptional regulator